MRKVIMAILIAMLALTAAACGEEQKKIASVNKPDTEAAATATEAEKDEARRSICEDSDIGGVYHAQTDECVTEDDSAPTEDEEYVEDDSYFEEEEPAQIARSLNQWGKDDGMKVKVTSMQEVSEIPPAPPAWLNDGVKDKPGSKLIQVNVDVKNDGNAEIDPLCGGGYGFTLLDEADRNFEPIDKLIDINNNVCDDGISPGFKSSYKLAYRIPNGSDIGGLVVWNSDAEDDFDGSLSQILFLP